MMNKTKEKTTLLVVPLERKVMCRHIVTKPSDDGTFEKGGHIIFEDDGSISCIEAMGWIDKSDVPCAIVGMESQPDIDWLAAKKKRLADELAALDALDA